MTDHYVQSRQAVLWAITVVKSMAYVERNYAAGR